MNECLDYFRQRSVYEKLFQKFKEKICQPGTYGRKSSSVRAYFGRKAGLKRILTKGLYRKQNSNRFRRIAGKNVSLKAGFPGFPGKCSLRLILEKN